MDEAELGRLRGRLEEIFRLAGEMATTPGLSNDAWTWRKIDGRAREIRHQCQQISEQIGTGRSFDPDDQTPPFGHRG